MECYVSALRLHALSTAHAYTHACEHGTSAATHAYQFIAPTEDDMTITETYPVSLGCLCNTWSVCCTGGTTLMPLPLIGLNITLKANKRPTETIKYCAAAAVYHSHTKGAVRRVQQPAAPTFRSSPNHSSMSETVKAVTSLPAI